jgi:hypothetical protein
MVTSGAVILQQQREGATFENTDVSYRYSRIVKEVEWWSFRVDG